MSAVAPVIDHFSARLRPVAGGPRRPRRGLSPTALAVMAEGLASVVTAESVPPLAGAWRRYAQLLATEEYEVWLIAWAATSALDLHDHGGSCGVARVVEGELVETYTDLVERHPLRSVTVGRGQSVALPATRAHEVWNPGPEPALSVHVYSPPLTSMTFYDHRGGQFLAPLRTEPGDLLG